MAGCREPYDVLFVDNKCNFIGVIGLRSITNHHRTPCSERKEIKKCVRNVTSQHQEFKKRDK